jgi:hypothetical protein
MRHIHETESTRSAPIQKSLQAARNSEQLHRRSALETQPTNEDRWRESQLEEPERWDGMS